MVRVRRQGASRVLVLAALAVLGTAACGGEKIQTNTELPRASFTATPTAARPQVVKLDATASFALAGRLAAYRWSLGDGSAEVELDGPTHVHSYTAAGEYEISLVVVDDAGAQSEPVTRKVTISAVNSAPPKALITGPSTALLGEELFFDGSGSAPSGDLQKYEWDFGDPASGPLNASGAVTAGHRFLQPGSYTVKLTVTDSLGQRDTAEHLVAVGQLMPTAVCTFSPAQALQGVPVTFDATQSTAPDGSSIKLYVWDLDDGSAQKTGATVTHTYNVQATFRPKLQVIDSQNRVAETTCPEVTVAAPPLCVAEYSLDANPKTQPCSFWGNTTWGGVKLNLEQREDGTVSATEQFNNQTITFTGTWAGTSFTMNGSYTQAGSLGDTITTDATVQGTFAGCGAWTGTWVETATSDSLGTLCTLTWNVSASRL